MTTHVDPPGNADYRAGQTGGMTPEDAIAQALTDAHVDFGEVDPDLLLARLRELGFDVVPRSILREAVLVLDRYRFWTNDEDEGNNEDVIEMIETMVGWMEQQGYCAAICQWAPYACQLDAGHEGDHAWENTRPSAHPDGQERP